MAHQARVRVRGIYTTALTALLLEQGSTIVDASPAIQQRFGLPQREALKDVSICDRRNRQGIIIEGEPAHVWLGQRCGARSSARSSRSPCGGAWEQSLLRRHSGPAQWTEVPDICTPLGQR